MWTAMKKPGVYFSVDFTGALDDLVDRNAAARLLGVAPRTLDRWHIQHIGPPRIQLGRKIRYRRRSLEQWVCSQEVSA
jgi:Helix-turn-helix domain